MANTRKEITLPAEAVGILALHDDGERLKAYDALFNYVFQRVEPQEFDDPITAFVWGAIFPALKRGWVQYENGKKGGRPKASKNPKHNPNDNPNSAKVSKNDTKNTENVDVSKVTFPPITPLLYSNTADYNILDPDGSLSRDKSHDPREPHTRKEFSEIVELWNDRFKNSAIPQIKGMTEKRRAQVRARLKEHGAQAFAEMIEKTAASKFLNGDNKRGWVADFDWCARPTNFQKIIEGNYDDKNNTAGLDGVAAAAVQIIADKTRRELPDVGAAF